MRPELIHPLIIHFPIALLSVGIVLRSLHVFFRNSKLGQFTLFSSWIFLALGVCFAWAAVIAGEIAADIVSPSLCKPDILDDHKNFAYAVSSLFTASILIDFLKTWKISFFPRFLTSSMSLLYLAGTVLLIFVGNFGSSLVYDQGAAVKNICQK